MKTHALITTACILIAMLGVFLLCSVFYSIGVDHGMQRAIKEMQPYHPHKSYSGVGSAMSRRR